MSPSEFFTKVITDKILEVVNFFRTSPKISLMVRILNFFTKG